MRNLDFGSLKRYNASRLVTELSKLDSALTKETTITLCGSASVLLQDTDFRETMDIDFCVNPSMDVVRLIDTLWQGKHLFDTNAAGVIGLLVDYDDRLVEVPLGFKFLKVRCLSKRDWIVSKLASPKVDDVLTRNDIDLDDLLWVQDHMYEYGGVSDVRAASDLKMLIREIEKRE